MVLAFLCWLRAARRTRSGRSRTHDTTADLRGIDNVGGGVAWASGTNGTVLRTEDGGYLWQACTVPPGAEHLDFRGVQAFDANTAIVMSSGKGDLSRLYKTTDGCQTWKLVFTNPDKDGFWDAVHASIGDDQRWRGSAPRRSGERRIRVSLKPTRRNGRELGLRIEARGLRGGSTARRLFAASNSVIVMACRKL